MSTHTYKIYFMQYEIKGVYEGVPRGIAPGGVLGAAPLAGSRGSAPGGVLGAAPLAGSKGQSPWRRSQECVSPPLKSLTWVIILPLTESNFLSKTASGKINKTEVRSEHSRRPRVRSESRPMDRSK